MKRFWKEVAVEAHESGHRITLDTRPVRTQGGADQLVPTSSLAEAMAEEWRAQGEEIDARSFPLRDLADFAIDKVSPDPAPTITGMLAYGETDTLCYRADLDDPLFERQLDLWEPLLSACEERHGIRFERISGIVHRPHPPETLERLRHVLEARNAFELSALNALASIASSLCVALAALEEDAEATALFAAANCEEDWQAERWGWDSEAEQARTIRLVAFEQAASFAKLAGS